MSSPWRGRSRAPHVYARVGERFVAALGDGGLRRATVEGVQAVLEAMRVRADGQPVKDATVNTYVGAVKSFLGFAHRVGYTRFNAAPFIKLKKAPRHVAQRIMGELETRKLIDAANAGRDRLMLFLRNEIRWKSPPGDAETISGPAEAHAPWQGVGAG